MNRCAPMMSSKPMVASHSPMHPDNSPFTTELESSEPITVTPRIASQNKMRRPKGQRPLRQHRRQEDQQQHPERCPPPPRPGTTAATPAPPGPSCAIVCPSSVVAIFAGRPRYLQQNGTHGTARDSRSIGRAQQDQPLCRLQPEGETGSAMPPPWSATVPVSRPGSARQWCPPAAARNSPGVKTSPK